ncbi:MAG: hypothetical protein WC986_10005 [Elusimicrobiota bacterium]|jgi:hypothetical protein
MKTAMMKKAAGFLAALALALACQGLAQAAVSDSLSITVTPSVTMGVDVDTATTRMSLIASPGDMTLTMAPGATAYFVSPASVTVLGNFNNQELQLQAAALNNWTIDADEVASQDAVQLYALFASNKSSAPVEAEFGSDSSRHLLTTSAQLAGEAFGSETNVRATNYYEIANGDMSGGADIDDLTVAALRQLWLRVDAPPMTTYSTNQAFIVTLTAVSGMAQ